MRPRAFWLLVILGVAVFVGLFVLVAIAMYTDPSTFPASDEARSPLFNPQVTQATIGTTICRVGWTATVRPPLSYTEPIKRALIDKLPADADHDPAHYELDHWVPLEVGGAPANPANLVLQPIGPALLKDRLENETHAKVCAHQLTLAQGRAVFTAMARP